MMRNLTILTGLSGAGKSSALRIFEDLGYETIDNLPLALLEMSAQTDHGLKPVVIVVDTRTRGFAPEVLHTTITTLKKKPDLTVTLCFLECKTDVLLQRYQKTRRHHPLAREGSIAQGISKEREIFQSLKLMADQVTDTSVLTPPQLRYQLYRRFGCQSSKTFTVTAISFAYPKGAPQEADMVLDLRFLPNPFYQEHLQHLTGQDLSIQQYLMAQDIFQAFFSHLTGLLRLALPAFHIEGRDFFSIALGCTGGRHRSVATVECLHQWLEKEGYRTALYHRDMGA